MTYKEWEEKEKISPASPEAYYAERAWNMALREACKAIEGDFPPVELYVRDIATESLGVE